MARKCPQCGSVDTGPSFTFNYDLMKRIPQVRFKQDSKWLEAHAGEKLRDCGYKVEGAH